MHDDHSCCDLTGELDERWDVEAVVERADERDHAGCEQHAVPQLVFFAETGRQEHEPGDQRPSEDRQAAKQRRRALRQAPLTRFVDRPHGACEAHRERRQQSRHCNGEQEGV